MPRYPEPVRATLELRRRGGDDAPRGVITACGRTMEFSGWLELSAIVERLLADRDPGGWPQEADEGE